MKINRTMRTLVAGACLALTTCGAVADPADAASALAEARQKLDAAAKRFAELSAVRDENVLESAEERAFLGIILQPVPADADSGGLAVMGVSPGSGAERAGLSVGDIVTRINDADLTIADEPMLALRTAMDAVSAGDVVTVGVMRDGVDSVLDVETDGRQIRRMVRIGLAGGADGGDTAALTWSDDTGLLVNEFDFDIRSLAKRLDEKFRGHGAAFATPVRPTMHLVDVGEALGEYFGVTSGALVINAGDDHPLRPGDVVQAIGEDVVRTAADAYRLLQRLGAPASAQVVRRQAMTTVEITPGATPATGQIERQVIRMRR